VEQLRLIGKKMKEAQTNLQHINDTAESLANLFSWAHPRKTQLVLLLLTIVVC
jgi:hypothetical protein